MTKPSKFDFASVLTPHGHRMDLAASSLQKCIRRGDLDLAIYFAVQIDGAGYSEYLWKRLKIVASEDVGLADRSLPATLAALYANWQELKRRKDTKHFPERLPLIHGVALCVTAAKSRLIDHILICAYNSDERREAPDYAADMHTAQGRRAGRGIEHFFREGAKLVAPSLPNEAEYETKARAILRDDPQLFEEE